MNILSVCILAIQESLDDKKRPELVRWVAGFQNLALAASAAGVCSILSLATICVVVVLHNVACQMWEYVSSYMHLRNCLRIAAEARSESKSWHLALGYDELCRKKWAEKAVRGKQVCLLMQCLCCRQLRFIRRPGV